jgi:hypothetical protein
LPIVTTGLRDDSGSWNTIEISRPRKRRSDDSGSSSNSVSSRRTEPLTVTPRLGSSPMMASEVTLFPHPDSPTSPTVEPAGTSKLSPSTARTGLRPRV